MVVPAVLLFSVLEVIADVSLVTCSVVDNVIAVDVLGNIIMAVVLVVGVVVVVVAAVVTSDTGGSPILAKTYP